MIDRIQKIQGWKIHHQEQLLYRAKVGSPSIRLKFFHHPNYRQFVRVDKFPSHCKVKRKGINTFFLFQQKVHTRGTISLDRVITVFPEPSLLNLENDWGKISEIPTRLKSKYHESSKFWPIKSPAILNTSEDELFSTDDLSSWVKATFQYVRTKIKHRERQDERLGAYQALLTEIGDCDEFTDLFITLARVRGIPCRRLTGYFIQKQGKKVEAHAWGEIFSPKMRWITVDAALNNLGNHTINYVIQKIEQFNPALSDYQIKTKHSTVVQYEWDRPKPSVSPVYTP
ncbi:MAG: transglutaminase-like domain-containing protein [Promethearchaeota archaeon]